MAEVIVKDVDVNNQLKTEELHLLWYNNLNMSNNRMR